MVRLIHNLSVKPLSCYAVPPRQDGYTKTVKCKSSSSILGNFGTLKLSFLGKERRNRCTLTQRLGLSLSGL